MSTIDLSQLSQDDLKKELQRREKEQEENRKAYKDLVNEVIPPLVKNAKNISRILSDCKEYTFKCLKDLREMKEKAYDVNSTQQTHSFTDNDGNTITYGFRVLDNWDDTVTAGIDKVRGFLQSLAKDEDSAKLVQGINRLLKKDAKGNLKASRVIELTKWAEDINNDEFTDAVNIIRKAYKPTRSAFFMEVSYKDAQGNKVSIPLSISSVDFPEGTDINALFPVHEKYQS